MGKKPRIIDPASLRYTIGGQTYRIGQRVSTPGGAATVTWFDLDAFNAIVVTLDSDGSDWRGSWHTVIPLVGDDAIERRP